MGASGKVRNASIMQSFELGEFEMALASVVIGPGTRGAAHLVPQQPSEIVLP